VKAESKEHLKCWNIEANDGDFRVRGGVTRKPIETEQWNLRERRKEKKLCESRQENRNDKIMESNTV